VGHERRAKRGATVGAERGFSPLYAAESGPNCACQASEPPQPPIAASPGGSKELPFPAELIAA